MNLHLKNKRALVSGSTSGIGLAVAKLLAKEGAEVVINGRSQTRIDNAITSIKKDQATARLTGIVADFNDETSVRSLIKQVGDIDILINNVGIFKSQGFNETDDADWKEMFNINVMSSVRLSRAFLPNMLENNWGRIIFISSECAMLVPEDMIAYSATKTALLSISRGLAQVARGSEVTVNSIMPGSTYTEGAQQFLKERSLQENVSEQQLAEEFFKSTRSTSLLGRFTTTEEIASTVVYLCSPLAVATNGATIKADGGSVPGIL
ncbi:SDR family NAD(P)-dependent oxidoreductase [Porifericola rhodea]|uniref:SDR family NAD(P)-dependent oxidoreductase n=1 Tax=Porifericola rhodea TaxID=930972 RepID=UPI002665E21F|nr:SDR family oxidoreductase [Porifericola rhodea]WKN32267.1 SDR family NAD(P)-dependent oxidoreductase [Porifericola rhodea]